MTTDATTEREQTGDALRALLKAKVLDDEVAALAEKCLKDLDRKPRVAVLGPAVAFGTETVNFIAGVRLFGPESGETFIQLLHGSSTKATAALEGSERLTFRDAEISKVFEHNPKVAQIRADAPALTKVDVVRAVSATPATLANMVKWVGKDADILLWCSEAFGEDEEAFWDALPDQMRGKALLLIPPAQKRNEALLERGSRVFGGVITVDPAAASAARSHSGGVNREAFAAAGGSDLVKGIKQEIERFERAALDAGKIVLMRHGDASAKAVAAPKSEPEAEPQAVPEPDEKWRPKKVVSIDRSKSRARSETAPAAKAADPREAIIGIFHRRAGMLGTDENGRPISRSPDFLDDVKSDIDQAMEILDGHTLPPTINTDFAKRMMKEASTRLSEIPPDDASASVEGAGILTQLRRDLGFVLSS